MDATGRFAKVVFRQSAVSFVHGRQKFGLKANLTSITRKKGGYICAILNVILPLYKSKRG